MDKAILVIDDDPLVRATLRLMLKNEGYVVTCAEDGGRGLAAFRRSRPDLVITDIIMPEKEGLETIMEIRAESPKARILAISGGAPIKNTDFPQMAKLLGADAIMDKPFETGDLIAQAHDLLRSSA